MNTRSYYHYIGNGSGAQCLMPGFIPHFIAGNALFLIGSYFIQYYTKAMNTKWTLMTLYLVCIFCSIIPDFPLGLFYVLHIGSYNDFIGMHSLLHIIISPIAVIVFIIGYSLHPSLKVKSMGIMAILCIFVHIILDATINEMSIWL